MVISYAMCYTLDYNFINDNLLLALANALQLHHMFHNQYTSLTCRVCVRTITLILDVLYMFSLLPLLLISSFIIALLAYCACSALLLSGYLRLFSFAIVPTITDHLPIYQFPGAHSLSQY